MGERPKPGRPNAGEGGMLELGLVIAGPKVQLVSQGRLSQVCVRDVAAPAQSPRLVSVAHGRLSNSDNSLVE